jgi:4-hydroxyphenylacetate 3-monooxygenase
MAMATAKEFFGKAGTDFASNVQKYYEHSRKNDLILTYHLINPQVNKGVGRSKQADPFSAVLQEVGQV